MSQITLAIRHVTHSERLFRWQTAAVFAGGSLTAGLFNLGALMALSVARSALVHGAHERRRTEHHV